LREEEPAARQAAASALAWYAVFTKPRQEQRALENLSRQAYDCLLPQWTVERLRGHKLVAVREPIFSRYLFIRLSHTVQDWSPIRSTRGVVSLVSFGGRPAVLADELVQAVRTLSQQLPRQTLFAPDSPVTVQQGPFAGIQGLYQCQDGHERALVLIEILGKTQKLSLPLGNIKGV
jgi:transcriptional antiterminator RfaH